MSKKIKKKYIRKFNTSGVSNPISHFYISRTIEIERALQGICEHKGESGGRFFTLFSSRQMGKTTFVNELIGKLDKEKYCPVVISFETMIDKSEKLFYHGFSEELQLKSSLENITDFNNEDDFRRFTKDLQINTNKKFVLIIDEFDGLKKNYLGKLLHTFREIYFHRGEIYNLHSLMLIGVRNITDVNMDNASPFNTNDEIQLPPFTKEQVFDLMNQYEVETGQNFEDQVKELVFYNTKGQPGLVNALCKMLVEDFNPGDKKDITVEYFDDMFGYFINAHISKNVSNIINKANDYKEKIIEIFNTNIKVPFLIDDPWITYLHSNGAISYEEVVESIGEKKLKKRYIKFANPIYQKKLFNYFRPDISSENSLYISVDESFKQYINPDKTLNILGILKNYQNYVNQRGKKAFSFAPKRKDGRRVEAVYHYSLDAYLNSTSNALGGFTSVEFPTGNGKVDIFFYYESQKYIIEIKSFANLDQIEQAKQQVCTYTKTEGLKEAYLVIFTEVHPRDRLDVFAEEVIEDVTIRSVLVNVNFELLKSAILIMEKIHNCQLTIHN